MPTLSKLATFNGGNGDSPFGALTLDAAGNLLGTTLGGGPNNSGTVFELSRTLGVYSGAPVTLANFNAANGQYPSGGLFADAAGNLLGTTQAGGAQASGTVFELAKTADDYATSPTTVVSFSSANGDTPFGGVVADSDGNLFGTTSGGGAYGGGTVFEIAKTFTGYASTPTVLVSFDGSNGRLPTGSLSFDATGNLFGTTQAGGALNVGTVFEISRTELGYADTPTTLVTFNKNDGQSPSGGLITDDAGNLIGTTAQGGVNDDGVIFEITKTGSGFADTPTVLTSFDGINGRLPQGDLIRGAAGNLYGVTAEGGPSNNGTVFELSKTADGYANAPTTLGNFDGTNGIRPVGGLAVDSAGNLFGSTLQSGPSDTNGTVFKVTDSGFQVACFAAGTNISTAEGKRAIESLQPGDLAVARSGAGLRLCPVKWLGQRRIDLRRHSRPETVAPVRIQHSAFANNLPERDLLVSPDHAIFADGKLICARQLINGTSIRQDTGLEAIHYYHLELDTHGILLAEGLSAESYIETGNRGFFANSDGACVLHLDLAEDGDNKIRQSRSCAPFAWEEHDVRPVWEALAARAAARGLAAPTLETTIDTDMRLRAGSRVIRPVWAEQGRYVFVVPNSATELRLISRHGSPADVRPWLDDRRCLGVYVERILLRGADELYDLPLDHPSLSLGWWPVERAAAEIRRWTNGDALVPLPWIAGPTTLEVQITAGAVTYRVDHPQESMLASARPDVVGF